jgi:hypothetical protein
MAQSVGPDVIERIRSAILGGDSIRSAAKKAGVSFHTAKKYLPVEVGPGVRGTPEHPGFPGLPFHARDLRRVLSG